MTNATAMTAGAKDALIAAATEAGLTVTRTSKDFFLTIHDDKQRVTPGEIKRLIAEAKAEEAARAEALELAEQIRTEEAAAPAVEPEVSEPEVQPEVVAAPTETPVVAEPVEQPAPAASKPAKVKAEKADRVIIKFGPPYGGDIAHLPVATHDDARNPIVHLSGVTVATKHKTKEEAAAAGRAGQKRGFLAFLAQDGQADPFWVVATVSEGGELLLDGTPVTLALLDGQAAEDARAKIKANRLKTKSQWQATAV